MTLLVILILLSTADHNGSSSCNGRISRKLAWAIVRWAFLLSVGILKTTEQGFSDV